MQHIAVMQKSARVLLRLNQDILAVAAVISIALACASAMMAV